MKDYHYLNMIYMFYFSIPTSALSDVAIKSPLGASVIFSEKIN